MPSISPATPPDGFQGITVHRGKIEFQIADRVPFRRDLGKGVDQQPCFIDSLSGANGAAAASLRPIFYPRQPFVSARTAPPDFAGSPRGDLIGSQGAVFPGVPFRDHCGEASGERIGHGGAAPGAERATCRSGLGSVVGAGLPFVVRAVRTFPPDLARRSGG